MSILERLNMESQARMQVILLDGGAAFNEESGVLEPTGDQYVEMRDTYDYIPRMAGALSLYDPTEADLAIPNEILIRRAERRAVFEHDLKEVTRPYEELFTTKFVPYPRPGERLYPDKVRTRKWFLDKKEDGIDTVRLFKVEYAYDAYGSRFSSVTMGMEREDELVKEFGGRKGYVKGRTLMPGFKFEFAGGDLQVIKPDFPEAGLGSLMTNIKLGQQLFSKPKSYCDKELWANGPPRTPLEKLAKWYHSDFQIRLTGDEIGLVYKSDRMPGGRYEPDESKRRIYRAYVYNPDTQTFELTVNEAKYQSDDISEVPTTLPMDDFLDIVRGVLELVPTDVEYRS